MSDLWKLADHLILIREEVWKNVATNTRDNDVLNEHHALISDQLFGFDIDGLIAALTTNGSLSNKTTRSLVEILVSFNFIGFNFGVQSRVVGRLYQWSHFFRQHQSNGTSTVHGSLLQAIIIRNTCLNEAFLMEIEAGRKVILHTEWFLPEIMLVPRTVISPVGLMQFHTSPMDIGRPKRRPSEPSHDFPLAEEYRRMDA